MEFCHSYNPKENASSLYYDVLHFEVCQNYCQLVYCFRLILRIFIFCARSSNEYFLWSCLSHDVISFRALLVVNPSDCQIYGCHVLCGHQSPRGASTCQNFDWTASLHGCCWIIFGFDRVRFYPHLMIRLDYSDCLARDRSVIIIDPRKVSFYARYQGQPQLYLSISFSIRDRRQFLRESYQPYQAVRITSSHFFCGVQVLILYGVYRWISFFTVTWQSDPKPI